jgi:predicted lipoprotein with Yx(FWY)xxD motif
MPAARSRRFPVIAAFAALGAVLAACGGAYASGGAQSGVAGASAVRKGAVVKLRKTAVGAILVDGSGRTLYLYTPDRKSTSTCYGQCASFWPPLLSSGKARAGHGVKASLIGVTMRKDGKHQVTYRGHPLYLFANDHKPGQVNGQGLQKIWWAVSAGGLKVTKKPTARATSATTIELRKTSLGTILVDSRGKTLYLYTPDRKGTSTCYGQCASFWPPLAAHGALVVGTGLKSSLLGKTKRTDGSEQVTYNGHPLYYFAQDSKAGDTKGEDVQGIWYAVSASGAKVEPGDDNGGTTTTQEPGYGGGY